MRASFNHALFRQFDLDSAALTQHCQLVHRFDRPGAYSGTVWRGEEPVADFSLRVREDSRGDADSVYVDLYALHRDARASRTAGPAASFDLGAGGYACFYVSWGEGGYAVTVEDAARDGAFDSRRLGADDIFVAMPIRPGSYELHNTQGGAACPVIVRYPDPRQQRDPDATPPAEVTSRENGFQPEALSILPAQGILVRTETPAHFTLTLKHPDHGPEDLRRLRARRRGVARLRQKE